MIRPLSYIRLAVISACTLGSSEAEVPPFGFIGPEMQRVEGQARALRAADFDQDGGLDAAYLNNGKARIEILYQRKPGAGKKPRPLHSNRWEPQLQDSRFERDSITTGNLMYELVAGDLNGDGRVDLAVSDDARGLEVYYQGKNLQWEDPVRIELKEPAKYQGTLLIEDLDGDGAPELTAVANHEIHFFKPAKDGRMQLEYKLPAANEDPYNLQARDLNGDGRLDLMYLNPLDAFALRIRLQGKDKRFGPEEVVAFDRPSGLIQPYPNGKEAGFVAVNRNNGQLEHFALTQRAPDTRNGISFSLQSYAYRSSNTSKQILHTWADLDGDGFTDLVTADPQASQLSVYKNEKGELQSPIAAPSYSDITSLSTLSLDGKSAVLICSPGEESCGISRWEKDGLAFPKALKYVGKPLASGSSTEHTVHGLVYQQNKHPFLMVANGDQTSFQELKDLPDKPEHLNFMDLNQDGQVDLLLEIPFKPLEILLGQANKPGYTQLDTSSGSSRSLLSRFEPGSLGIVDLDRDGKDELLMIRKGFVRSVRLAKDKTFETVRQINASRPDMKISAAAHLPVGDTWQMVLVDRDKHRLELHQTHPPAPHQAPQSFDLPESPIVQAEVVQLRPDGPPELILYGKKLFWRLSAERPRWQVKRVSRYETDLPRMQYRLTGIGDLNHDQVPDIIGVDNLKTHLMEVLSYKNEIWQSQMHFKIFESDRPNSQGTQNEPREILLEDFTSDGRTDVMMLIHDRMLLYPQDQ